MRSKFTPETLISFPFAKEEWKPSFAIWAAQLSYIMYSSKYIVSAPAIIFQSLDAA